MPDSVEVSIDIDVRPGEVWAALTMPDLVRRYMMGATIETDWVVGHPITWSGEWQGRPYQDKGMIKAVSPERLLSVTHWSPLSPLPDMPENYHLVTYELRLNGAGTLVTLIQENLTGTAPDEARRNWRTVLEGLKQVAEGQKI